MHRGSRKTSATRVVGLLATQGPSEGLKPGRRLHQLSLHGRGILEYSRDVLSRFCDALVEFEVAAADRVTVSELSAALMSAGIEPSQRRHQSFLVLLHDGLWPYLTGAMVSDLLARLREGARVVALGERIERAVLADSEGTVAAAYLPQTPIGFSVGALGDVLARSGSRSSSADALSLLMANRQPPAEIVPGPGLRPPIRSPADLATAEGVLKFRADNGFASPPSLEGRRILVLGGSGGIGRACLKGLKRAGALWQAPPRTELDLSTRQDFSGLADFDGVVHAAGAYATNAEEILAVNLLSAYDLIRAAEALSWTGSIVLLSSTAATFGRARWPVYSASKAALNSLIEARATDLAEQGALLNAIAPARVDTRLQQVLDPGQPRSEMLRPEYVASHVLSMLGSPSHGRIVYLRNGVEADQATLGG